MLRPDTPAPWNLGARPLACVEDSVPRRWRGTPFAPLRDDYAETISLDITVGATSQESRASRLIYGPFRIDSYGGRVGVGGTNGARLQLSTGVNDSVALIDLTTPRLVTREIVSDATARFIGGLDLTTLWIFTACGFVERGPLSQLLFSCQNTSAGGQNFLAMVKLTHLLPADCADARY